MPDTGPVGRAEPLVKGAEGLRLCRYLCPAGVWTIGWGSTRGLDGLPVTAATPDVTMEQAQWLLDRDMAGALGWVRRLVKVPLQDGQAAALLSFVQNLGPGRLQSSTLLRLLNSGRYDQVPTEFGKWVMGGGQRLPGLVLRRAAERALWLSGDAGGVVAPPAVAAAPAPVARGWAADFLGGFRAAVGVG